MKKVLVILTFLITLCSCSNNKYSEFFECEISNSLNKISNSSYNSDDISTIRNSLNRPGKRNVTMIWAAYFYQDLPVIKVLHELNADYKISDFGTPSVLFLIGTYNNQILYNVAKESGVDFRPVDSEGDILNSFISSNIDISEFRQYLNSVNNIQLSIAGNPHPLLWSSGINIIYTNAILDKLFSSMLVHEFDVDIAKKTLNDIASINESELKKEVVSKLTDLIEILSH